MVIGKIINGKPTQSQDLVERQRDRCYSKIRRVKEEHGSKYGNDNYDCCDNIENKKLIIMKRMEIILVLEISCRDLQVYTNQMATQMNLRRKRPNKYDVGDLVRIVIPE
ncbi:hypothetical protein RCL_jg2941.t1 [Rhizophagus clarus]|uniref:Uncharacterized protein n=1 Tax=Rhizophagus clarus TaxID=94130 RepID=A0A8H3M8F5_9GLOM|nr:hypothetical protein RCL_jg2941.t1 [Rhizophagus clarus]